MLVLSVISIGKFAYPALNFSFSHLPFHAIKIYFCVLFELSFSIGSHWLSLPFVCRLLHDYSLIGTEEWCLDLKLIYSRIIEFSWSLFPLALHIY